MTLHKPTRDTPFIIECDSCDAEFHGNSSEEFMTFWDRAKMNGWRTKKIAGEWLHGCPQCGVGEHGT